MAEGGWRQFPSTLCEVMHRQTHFGPSSGKNIPRLLLRPSTFHLGLTVFRIRRAQVCSLEVKCAQLGATHNLGTWLFNPCKFQLRGQGKCHPSDISSPNLPEQGSRLLENQRPFVISAGLGGRPLTQDAGEGAGHGPTVPIAGLCPRRFPAKWGCARL